MIVSTPSLEYPVTDFNGNVFTPNASIAYFAAFNAFLPPALREFRDTALALNIFQLRETFGYMSYTTTHNNLMRWLSANLTGKYALHQFSFLSKSESEYVYFELAQDAVLFKLSFS